MRIKKANLKVDKYNVNPTLIVELNFEYERGLEIPISVSGRLNNQDGRAIAELNENKLSSDRDFGLKLYNRNQKEKYKKGRIEDSFYLELSAHLSPLSVNAIENRRNQNADKSITLHIELLFKTMVLEVDQTNSEYHDFVKVKKQRQNHNIKIGHSEWINNFSESLGIGKFILVELRIPDKEFVSDFWRDKYAELVNNLEKMESSLRAGDWEKTMIHGRKYFENFKFGDVKSKPANKKFKEELDKVLLYQNYSESAIKNFYDGVRNFFDFTSKYVHEQDTKGYPQSPPLVTLEDSYFIYNLAIGLLNMITKKIVRGL
jgi:hypothetical protein